MANEEQLSILRQGVQVWNKWRRENPNIRVDLNFANFRGANLRKVDLSWSHLEQADFSKADLTGAELMGANFSLASLREARVTKAHLRAVDFSSTNLQASKFNNSNLTASNFRKANLIGASLKDANLTGADLREAYLKEAVLSGVDLSHANLKSSDLFKTNFSDAYVGYTDFSGIDLSQTEGLEKVHHRGPSSLGIDTIRLSAGKIPEVFLRGCGLSDAETEFARLSNPGLRNEEINEILYKLYDLRASRAIQISPLFISYSHADNKFVDKIEEHLNSNGIRFWRDIHDMKAGRLEKQIDKAISQNPTVLLVLSKPSLNSDWVEHEVRTARVLEREIGRDVLCPVALDDSWKKSRWEKHLMEQVMKYNILDFSEWEDDVRFEGMFRKLIGGLELFYK